MKIDKSTTKYWERLWNSVHTGYVPPRSIGLVGGGWGFDGWDLTLSRTPLCLTGSVRSTIAMLTSQFNQEKLP